MAFGAEYKKQLEALAGRGRLRRLIPREGRDFASNDYLGLSHDPFIAQAIVDAVERGVPLGSGGSRLLRGNAPEHGALEEKAARFFGSEGALYFSSGFAANTALFSTLPQKGDLILADELIHASAHDGLRMARAEYRFARHNDVNAFEAAIRQWRTEGGQGRVWIAFETLYSMDGDVAPISGFASLAAAEDAWLLLDEAHATGIYGPQGKGLAAALEGQDNVVSLHTCGKGLGAEGALVCASKTVIDYLVNRARPFIFSTAPSPLMAVAVSAALDRVAEADDLRARLMDLRAHADKAVCERFGLPSSKSQIIPVILGEDKRTMRVAETLQAAGFDIRGIRPPTVPRGTSRLRLSLNLNVDESDISALAEAMARAMEANP
ncbi:8-amino-7-oxononanoate synthase [Rhizorhapis suberifaciens]|uniref:8-amino-7-oxononanoate synthase n=1 Tax=Rhizorhapis suberifaciens TaxID=13656 RepID=A0A840HVA0_9SPHN|nr:8-amino-7-oxononanoate synthase [Rhizorhapis suberifaciens]MBB4642222.1 8-amino-7-oxononanoate synthase [Rhizorhapis suberifaciens]